VTYRISSNWGTGFGAQVEIRNPGSSPLQDWVLQFDLPSTIDSLWNGTVLARQGTTYRVGPASWNRTIPAGGSVSFGFNGSPGGAQAQAGNFVLSSQSSQPNPVPTPTPTATPTPTPTQTPTPTPTPPNPGPPAQGFLSTSGSRIIDSQGQVVTLNGLNWFGMETETFAPHGLWTRSMDSMLDQIQALGYDTLRIPFSNEALRPGSVPNGIDFAKNPDLAGKSAVAILDILVAKCGQRGIRVLLDRHRPTKSAQSDLWYTSEVSEEQWISDWEMLARRYKGNPTVIGADLHNEPHGRATWGSGSLSTDWRLAAQRAGNRILAANPDWLIVVEGVESVNGQNYWWGGNLRNAGSYPVTLAVANRVVYSTHDYATSVYNQPWFSAPNYPANLPGIWDANWGYLLKQNIAPVLVGEFGTHFSSQVDQVWLRELVKYIEQNGASFTYWCWNPNSTDTGGILKSDWHTVEDAKQAVLNPLLSR
jgi:aryl-phospho-beta-D-glucosidase BglC (GH1 family)